MDNNLKDILDIASFMEHPVYSIFKMYSVLILLFSILFCHVLPKKLLQKLYFLEVLGVPQKKQW